MNRRTRFNRTWTEPGARAASARVCAAIRKGNKERERDTMTTDEIDHRIIEAIIDAQTKRGAVTRADLVATNIPPERIDARFKRCLAQARELCPQIENIPSFA